MLCKRDADGIVAISAPQNPRKSTTKIKLIYKTIVNITPGDEVDSSEARSTRFPRRYSRKGR